MAEVFADTSGWAEYFLKTMPFHPAAAERIGYWRTHRVRVVTTNYVLAELSSLLMSPLRVAHPDRVRIGGTIRSARWVDIVHIDEPLDEDAWALFKTRPDKEWSLTDCASFVVMRRRGIAEALTTDHHFEQAGFVRLLK